MQEEVAGTPTAENIVEPETIVEPVSLQASPEDCEGPGGLLSHGEAWSALSVSGSEISTLKHYNTKSSSSRAMAS